VKVLFLLLLVSGLALLPLVALRRPWAIKLWQRFKLVVVIYAVVVAVTAIVSLIFNWDGIYG
jgi:uncharacterized membrane protein SirB2